MKGIILAGGSGTRLYPLTQAVSKQLMPVYDKPIIYYPLSTLMLAGIKDILIISTPDDTPMMKRLLGDGRNLGINLSYEVQETPKGLAEACIIGEKFIDGDSFCLILGDNILYGQGLSELLMNSFKANDGATIFGYYVNDPEKFGVIEFGRDKKAISIEEKPLVPKSNYAAIGLYVYDNSAVDIAKQITPSERGELEITDVNKVFLKKNQLSVELLRRGFAWLDVGTHNSRMDAGNFIRAIEDRQGLKVACLEEIAYRRGYITGTQLRELAEPLIKSGYGEYLLRILNE